MPRHQTADPSAERDVPLIGEPWGVPRAGGRLFAKDPSVVRFGDRYLMYFTLPPEPESGTPVWHIGIAESDDLRGWQLAGRLQPGGEAEARGLAAPGAVVIGDTVHLFYQSYGNGPRDAICHASSADGVIFVRDSSNPVFRPTGSWNCGRAIDADVLVDGDRLLMAYATRDPEMRVQILGVAAAPLDSAYDRASWTDLSVEAPALAPELDWELQCLEAPALIRRGDHIVMFYAGGYNNEPQQIGYATSLDGVRWERGTLTPFLPRGGPGSWNSSESGHPGVFRDHDDRSYLFFQGNDSQGSTNVLAAVELGWDGSRPSITDRSAGGSAA